MNEEMIDQLKFDAHGLIPAVVQDYQSGTVLMLAYMNRESLLRTLQKRETFFWSRSRNELWHKGASSGNTQTVKRILHDCDSDTLLVQVDQKGAACHTGRYSCFFVPVVEDGDGVPALGEVLSSLARVIHKRNLERPQGSYTTTLFEGGTDRILKKVGEEAGEIIIAAKNHQRKEISWEVSDLLYHLLVMLEAEGVTMRDIAAELTERSNVMKKK